MKSYKERAAEADKDFEAFEKALEEGRDPGLVPAKAKVSPNASSTFSVRLKPGEMGVLSKAADAAGLPLGTFMRLASLAAAAGELKLNDADRAATTAELRAKLREVEELCGRLEATSPTGQASPT